MDTDGMSIDLVYLVAALVGLLTALSPLLTNRLTGQPVSHELVLRLSALAIPYAAVMVGFVWLVGR